MFEPPGTIGLGFRSAAIHVTRYGSSSTAMVLSVNEPDCDDCGGDDCFSHHPRSDD